MRFDWDPAKDKANRKRHGLFFDEAAELFRSRADYLDFYDEEHSDEEDRFIAVGRIQRGVVLVAYTEREDDVVRIVSARMATKKERRRFEEYEREGHERRHS